MKIIVHTLCSRIQHRGNTHSVETYRYQHQKAHPSAPYSACETLGKDSQTRWCSRWSDEERPGAMYRVVETREIFHVHRPNTVLKMVWTSWIFIFTHVMPFTARSTWPGWIRCVSKAPLSLENSEEQESSYWVTDLMTMYCSVTSCKKSRPTKCFNIVTSSIVFCSELLLVHYHKELQFIL